jgi:hypothetical protein
MRPSSHNRGMSSDLRLWFGGCWPLRVDKETVDDNGFRIRIKRRPYRTNRGKGGKGKKVKSKRHMAQKGNPISVRLDLNRSSDPSRFSEGDRESHRMGLVRLFLIFVCPPKKGVRGRCRCPGRTRLLLTLEDHRKKPGTRACRERRTRGGRASTVSPGHS